MLGTLINKELKSIILSPKFTGTFLICTALILLSVITGIIEYKAMNERYAATAQLTRQDLESSTSWARLSTTVSRAPEPLRILVSGLDYDIGRHTLIGTRDGIKLKGSAYSDEPIYSVFRFLDFAFIVKYILTLFAILFTYNAINGEREDGTLKLVFSNSLSRVKYLAGKYIGAWLGLAVPITIAVLLGLLMLVIFKIPLSGDNWIQIGFLLLMALALFTFFISLGLLVSSLTRKSSVSFLISLVLWIMFVLIIPRTGVMAAGHIVHVPRMAEIESRLNQYAQTKWDKFNQDAEQRWADKEDEKGSEGICDASMWEMLEIEDSVHAEVEENIDQYSLKLREELRQRKIHQERVAYNLSRISPVAAFQMGAMTLAGTDVEMKSRFEERANEFREEFNGFVRGKMKETGDMGRIIMTIATDEDGNQDVSSADGRKNSPLDLGEIPKFSKNQRSLSETTSTAITDFGLIMVFSILSFFGAAVAFVRYDVR